MNKFTLVNKRNPHKFIEVHYDLHSHNYVRQFIKAENGVVTYPGDGKFHRWRKQNLLDLVDDYEFYSEEIHSIAATCSCCGKTKEFMLTDKEYETLKKYWSYGRELGAIQDLFPRVPAWIRSGAIDQYSNGFCICPKCM